MHGTMRDLDTMGDAPLNSSSASQMTKAVASLHLDGDHTLMAVVELSLSSWLVGGVVPGVERQPLKKLKPEPGALLELLHR
jgi:transposase